MKNTFTKFVLKYNYYIYTICILANIYPAIQLNLLNIFALGWCSGLLFCSLINDDII